MINLNKIKNYLKRKKKFIATKKLYMYKFFFSFKKTQDDSQQFLVAQIDVFDLKVGYLNLKFIVFNLD